MDLPAACCRGLRRSNSPRLEGGSILRVGRLAHSEAAQSYAFHVGQQVKSNPDASCCFKRFPHSPSDLELHLSFLGVHDKVVAMQHFAVQDLQRQRILN
jgi:hypothetical protein